jgi:hypothetical protein
VAPDNLACVAPDNLACVAPDNPACGSLNTQLSLPG